MADTPESTEGMGIPEDLEEIKGELTAVFHGQGQRMTEYRVVVAQGLKKVQDELEATLNGARELLARSAEIFGDAQDALASTDRYEGLQSEIEAQLRELKRVNNELGDAGERLRSEREDLMKQRKETTDGNETVREEIHKLTSELDRLEIDNEVVRKDLKSLQRKKNTLQKEVDALQERRQEFLAEIAKYKEVKAGLVS